MRLEWLDSVEWAQTRPDVWCAVATNVSYTMPAMRFEYGGHVARPPGGSWRQRRAPTCPYQT
jgi:hypothetical protein